MVPSFTRPRPDEEPLLRARTDALSARPAAGTSPDALVAADSLAHVLFTCGQTRYLIQASRVSLVLPGSAIRAWAPVPGIPPERAFLCDLRGRVLPVFRFPGLVQGAEAGRRGEVLDPETRARILVIDDTEGAFGMIVESLEDVIEVAPDALRPLPAGLVAHPDPIASACSGWGPADAIALSVDALLAGPWFRIPHQDNNREVDAHDDRKRAENAAPGARSHTTEDSPWE